MKNMAMMMMLVLVAISASLLNVFAVETCSKCGNMEVPYPFSTNDHCGDARYRVYCNNDILEFLSSEGFYYKIKNININAHTLVIHPPGIGTNTCSTSDLKVGGLKLAESSPFNISTRNTVMLFNCSETILLSPLNCSSNSLCRHFEQEVEEGNVCMNTLCCTFLKDASISSHRIRVRLGGCTAYTSVVDMMSGETPKSWNYGIELQWLPPN